MKEYRCWSFFSTNSCSVAGIRYVLACPLAMLSPVWWGGAVAANEGMPLAEVAAYARTLETRVVAEPLELDEVLQRAGLQPTALANWVRDNIAYEPYAGIMKGPRGTLISRRGGAADQALLLASLLERAGLAVEMARGRIPLAALPQTTMPPWPGESAEPTEEELAELAADLSISTRMASSHWAAARLARQQFLEELWSRTMRDLSVLAETLHAEDVPVPAISVAEAGGENADVEHWWVRTADGDLDPVLGEPFGQAEATYRLTQLPDQYFHRLTIRMFIQRSEGEPAAANLRESETVLDATLKTARLFGETLIVGNVPLDIADALAELPSPTPEEVVETLAATTRFQPQLTTPQGVLSGHPFDLSGQRLQVQRGRIEAVRDLGGGLGGLFAPAPRSQKPTTRLASHWLEMTLHSPEVDGQVRPPVRLRREILRHPLPGKQAVLDLLATRELLLMPDQLCEQWLTREWLRYAAAWAETASFMLAEPENHMNLANGVNIEEFAAHPHLTGELYAFGLGRRHELRRLRETIAPETVYWNQRPLAVSHVRRLIHANKQGRPAMQAGLDILHNHLTVAGPPVEDWSRHLAFAAGVLDTALELQLIPAINPCDRRSNASLALETGRARRHNPRLEATAEDGIVNILVDRQEPAHAGAWYRVSLLDGNCLGMVDGGGQAMTEYAQRVNIALQLHGMLKFYGNMFKCLGTALTMPLAMDPGAQTMDLQECVWNLVCGKLTDVFTAHVNVATNWSNIIAKRSVDHLYSGVCKGMRRQVLGR